MRAPQLTLQEIITVFRRRRKIFFLPCSIVFGLCVVGAFVLPRKYESSTTIMVQRDEVLNPLISYTMAVTMASEDRLRTFNEIVYSRKTIQLLIDSLEMGEDIETEEDRQKLIEKIRKVILTERPGSSTFRIAYLDTDPERAQRAASLLADYFIQTILRVENQRNEMAVEFFEKKLDELRVKYESGQKEMVTFLRSRISEMPTESRFVSGRLEDVENDVGDLDYRLKSYQQQLSVFKMFPEALYTNNGKQLLFDL
ncbi:MAG: Wzz/FepE/Etk N-terminal domain-containing protein [Bacteroidota bacterium]